MKLKKTSTGVEFLEYGERQTKTRLGDDTNDVRPIAPKMFSLPNSDRCPVLTYKVFAEKRPTQMNFDELPFYLAVNNIKTDSLDKKPWFKQSPVGVNKLNSIMKVMSEKAELNKPRLKNHSGRKTMMQTVVNEEIPPTDIIQLSGHRNHRSVHNYATVSEKQQMKMSRTLSAFTTGIVSKIDAPREESSCGSSSENNKMLVSQHRTEHTVTSSTCGQQQALQIFAGATISGGNIHVLINTLNKSPILPTSPEPKYQRCKRLLGPVLTCELEKSRIDPGRKRAKCEHFKAIRDRSKVVHQERWSRIEPNKNTTGPETSSLCNLAFPLYRHFKL